MSDTDQSSSGSRPGKFVAPSLEDLDSVLSAYEFLEVLGQGGMGAVYKVRQHSLDRLAAIKVMPKFEQEDGENFGERFQREARAMGRLSHVNIVSVYDFGQTSDGLLYIVMEYVDGADLHQMINTGELTLDHLFAWFPQICSALEYAHSQGIVHRDIKPGNIMISKDGTVKVADFGLAKLTGSDTNETRLTMTNMAMGTPDYAAPEVFENGVEPDHRVDIYAVGVMLYQILTGKIPRGAWRPPSALNSHIDARFDALVTKAMDPDRDSRHPSASAISAELTSIWATTDDAVPIITEKEDENASPDSVSKPESGARTANSSLPSNAAGANKSKVPAVVGIAAASLAVVGLAVFLITRSANDPEGARELDITAVNSKSEAPSPPEEDSATGNPVQATVPGDTPQETAPEPVAVQREMKTAENVAAEEVEPETTGPEIDESPPASEPDGSLAAMPKAAPEPSEESLTPKSEPSDAMPETDTSEGKRRVEELLGTYRDGYERTMLTPHRKAVEELDSKYLGALERQLDSLAAAGNLDEVLAYRDEIERVRQGDGAPADDESIPDSLRRFRHTYREEMERLLKAHLQRVATVIEPLDAAFLALEQEFTRNKQVDDALAVREERTGIHETGLPFVDFDTKPLFAAFSANQDSETAENTTGDTSADDRDETEIAAADRRAAEWVLEKGGEVEIQIGSNSVKLKADSEESANETADLLPAPPFELIGVNFAGNRNIPSDEFARFPPAPNLRKLNLSQTLFSDRNCTRILRDFPSLEELQVPHAGANEWAATIADVPTLRTVSFYRTLLDDDGARQLSKSPWIVKLYLTDTRITPKALETIAKLGNLEELQLGGYSDFRDKELPMLYGLSNLKILMLHGWDVTEEGVAALKKEIPKCKIYYSKDGSEVVVD